jgi:penicillin-binding protein 1B
VSRPPSARSGTVGSTTRGAAKWRRRWLRALAAALAVPTLIACFAGGYYYVTFARLIDARLDGERERVLPRIFARPLELRRGQALTDRQLVDRLNDLGYAERPQAERPGEFALRTGAVFIVPRSQAFEGKVVRVGFEKPVPAGLRARRVPAQRSDRIEQLELGSKPADTLTLDTPLLASYVAEREKRRPVALATLPPHVVQAVLAIEDRRFYEHPGIDPIRMAGALVTNVFGNKRYLEGGSTITQQLARNFFLTDELAGEQAAGKRSYRRKFREQLMSIVLETRASKDEILELYLNDVYLGQRGSFAVHGVAQAARLFFGKDVTNLGLSEAALIAGTIQAPSTHSPFGHPERAEARRNVVLQAMADAGFITEQMAGASAKEPLGVVQRALEAEAPYFVDYVGQALGADYPGLTTTTNRAVEVYTTLDLHLQRLAQDAVRNGLKRVDDLLARRRRKTLAEAALLAVDPRTGDILAMVGGRSYNRSQYNRAVVARRQPGSVFKPFVYLAAFEYAADQGLADISPATVVDDSPTTWEFDDQVWTPENYESKYDGPITLRHALAHSRNLATIKLAERAGYDRVAALWKRLSVGTPPKPYPSIALGVFEATPFEIASAYTIFSNGGMRRPLRHILRITSGGADVTGRRSENARAVSRPETTFLVTSMLRSVINEGTGAGARSGGFALDAAGKTGTTNDLRDAWFAGFTPELLVVVWVGLDDNQPLGLSGAQAALPVWTEFMTRALAGHDNVPFDVPPGVTFTEIDRDTGKLAAPFCPRVLSEAFIEGTEPTEVCDLHRF